MQHENKPDPKYVRIGELVKRLGLSAEYWRRLAAAKKVRCVRPGGPGTYRVFDLESCEQYLRGDGAAIQTATTTRERNRERNAAFIRRCEAGL